MLNLKASCNAGSQTDDDTTISVVYGFKVDAKQ